MKMADSFEIAKLESLKKSALESRQGQVDVERVRESLMGTIGGVNDRFGINVVRLNEIADKMESQLPKDWYEKWKSDSQGDMWVKAGSQLLNNDGRWMRMQGTDDSDRRTILSAVSWIMVGRKVLSDVEDVNVGIPKLEQSGAPDSGYGVPRKSAERIDFGEENGLDINELEGVRRGFIEDNRVYEYSKRGGWKIEDGNAIVQFNGRVIEQVRVQDRNTCILAVMQMLLSHSGHIRSDAHVSLIEAKGDMIQLAEKIGALSDNIGGTLRIEDVERSVRPMIEETQKTLINAGKAESAGVLGTMGVEYWSYFDGYRDMDVYDALMTGGGGERIKSASALAIMAGKWQNKENVVFGYTHVDQIGEYNTDGHQRIINGVSMIEGQYYFHIIDPLTKMSNNGWVRGIDLVKHLTGPIFWAESKEQPSNLSSITLEEVSNENGAKQVGHKRIVWSE